MRYYIAARFDRGPELAEFVNTISDSLLEAECTATWLLRSLHESLHKPLHEAAFDDFNDLLKADVCIFFAESSEVGYNKGGRHVEFGMALALGHEILVVGPKENVFHHAYHYPTGTFVRHFEDKESLLEYLRTRRRE